MRNQAVVGALSWMVLAGPAHSEELQFNGGAEYSVELRGRFFRHGSGLFETEDAFVGGLNRFVETEVLLVLVDLSGPRFPMGRGASVDILARSSGRVLEHKWVSLATGYFSETGRTTVPILVYGAGVCKPLEIVATLLVGGKRQTVRKEIPLACGE